MNCQYEKTGKAKNGMVPYRCVACGHRRKSRYRPEKIHRSCPASLDGIVRTAAQDSEIAANLLSIQANGPERTAPEVLVIIANYCTSCPDWNPAAKKKKCKYCGCGSSDTVENLHKRRIRNCPKGHWTEASLQRYLHSEATPDPLAPAKTEPKPEPCTVCGKPATTVCGYTSFLMCGAPLCDTCTHPHRL